ncbi:MAG: hypothetical protein ACREA4_12760, partial [Nitrososphaera sp.]
ARTVRFIVQDFLPDPAEFPAQLIMTLRNRTTHDYFPALSERQFVFDQQLISSLVPPVSFHELEKLEVRFEPEILHEAIDFAVAVLWMAVLDAFRVFYQVQFAINPITKKT